MEQQNLQNGAQRGAGERIKRRRQLLRARINSVIGTPAPEENASLAEKSAFAQSQLESISEMYKELEEFNKNIVDRVGEEEIEDEIKTCTEFDQRINLFKIKMRQQLNIAAEEERSASLAGSRSSTSSDIRLKRFELPKFSGNPLEWTEFWDCFSAMVDQSEFSETEKFWRLRECLSGSALLSIKGLSRQACNYTVAKELLKKQFGNLSKIIDTHVSKISTLECSNDSAKALRVFYDQAMVHIRALESLGMTESSFGTFVVPILNKKLPKGIQLRISRAMLIEGSDGPLKLTQMMNLLQQEVQAHELCDVQPEKGKKEKEKDKKSKSKAKDSGTVTSLQTKAEKAEKRKRTPYCIFCQSEDHFTSDCETYTGRERKERAIELKRCIRCLAEGHFKPACPQKKRCYKCRGKHHTAMHEGEPNEGEEKSGEPTKKKQKTEKDSSVKDKSKYLLNCNIYKQKYFVAIILQSAICHALNGPKNLKVRVFLDPESTHTFVTEKLIKILKLTTQNIGDLTVSGVGNMQSTQSTKSCKLSIMPLDQSKFIPIQALSINKLPDLKQYPEILREYIKVPLADNHQQDLSTNILIGADYYWLFMKPQYIEVSPTLVLHESIFGYILSGSIDKESSQEISLLTKADKVKPISFESQESVNWDQMLKNFWELEAVGISDSETSIMDQFLDNLHWNGERYEISLPWRDAKERLPTNFGVARARLNALVNKLNQKPELLKRYAEVIKEQLSEGIIEKLNEDEISKSQHFIPHRCVVDDKRKTTKLRIVYDASCKNTKTSLSLNDCLYCGPCLLPELVKILMRMRLSPILVVSDIESAFHKIGIDKKDQSYLTFLWYDDPVHKSGLVAYQFTRVMFGLICSPFLLNATVKYHLENISNQYPSLTNILAKVRGNLYVDDMVIGCNTHQEAKEIYKTATFAMSKGDFNLRKWSSNDQKLINNISQIDKHEKAVNDDHVIKVLGIPWDRTSDTLSLNLQEVIETVQSITVWTKRNILKCTNKIFDPLGLISPLVVQAKVILQSIAHKKWDEEIDNQTSGEFIDWSIALNQQIQIPRYYSCMNKKNCLSLHGFCDASERSVGAVIYLVNELENKCETELVFSKTRVAPLKQLSIPRLELYAALILARSIKIVRESLLLDIKEYLWTDSQTSLAWILGKKDWGQWVSSKVKEIHELTQRDSWRWVKTEHNPADIQTRRERVKNLSTNHFWWHGPEWLQNKSEWPERLTTIPVTNEAMGEVKKSARVMLTEANSFNLDFFNIKRHNSLYSFKKVIARILALSNGIREKNCSLEWLNRAETFIIKAHQQKHFEKELEKLQNKEKPKGNLAKFNLFLDDEGIIRIKGRLAYSTFCLTNTPILLQKDYLSFLFIKDSHERVGHLGIEATIADWKETFYIIRGRALTKAILRKCAVCWRVQGRPYAQEDIAALAEYRVTEKAPFSMVGIDFCGPINFLISPRGKVWKGYILLFTCAVTRAVHLELTLGRSAEEVTLAIRRFCSRFGLPNIIISDNASEFRQVGRELKELKELLEGALQSKELSDFLQQHQIKWQFIPPRAPWWGGFYERMIGLTKRILKKKILTTKMIHIEQLWTLLLEVEACINSRPICSFDAGENQRSLSPFELIYGKRLLTLPDERDLKLLMNKRAMSIPKLFQSRTNARNQLWALFKNQYLTQLRAHWESKIHKSGSLSKPQVGDIVLIEDKLLPRLHWKTGVVEELFPGRDGKVRSVSVRTLTSGNLNRLQRSTRSLIPLESGQILG